MTRRRHDPDTADQLVVAPTLTAANNPSRSPQSSEITAQVEAVLAVSENQRAELRETKTAMQLTSGGGQTRSGLPDDQERRDG
jgi:hypothetical protein